jgi:hypothetical protein
MANIDKSGKRHPKPLLAAAVFCERILETAENVLSAINIIDTFIVYHLPDALSQPDQRLQVSLKALVALRAGNVIGERNIRLVLRIPTGKRKMMFERAFQFKGGEQGVNMNVSLMWEIKTQGLYWVDVMVEGARVTRMPLRIVFQPVDPGSAADKGQAKGP